jgi:hypothetical protein
MWGISHTSKLLGEETKIFLREVQDRREADLIYVWGNMYWNNEIFAQNLRFRGVEIIKNDSNEKTEDIDKLPKCAWCECITHEEEVYLKWGAYKPNLVLLKENLNFGDKIRKKKPTFFCNFYSQKLYGKEHKSEWNNLAMNCGVEYLSTEKAIGRDKWASTEEEGKMVGIVLLSGWYCV